MSGYEVPRPILNSPFDRPVEHWLIVEGEEPQPRVAPVGNRDGRDRLLFFAQREAAETPPAGPEIRRFAFLSRSSWGNHLRGLHPGLTGSRNKSRSTSGP